MLTYIFLLLPVVAIIATIIVVYMRNGLQIVPIVVSALIAAAASGLLSGAIIVTAVSGNNPYFDSAEIALENMGVQQGQGGTPAAPGRDTAKIKNNEKWSGDFWEHANKRNSNRK